MERSVRDKAVHPEVRGLDVRAPRSRYPFHGDPDARGLRVSARPTGFDLDGRFVGRNDPGAQAEQACRNINS